ncbi:sodium:alanine symporter family protein [Endozoicomonas sp. SM1973]|uniref:Sodium:alanine symporter family protein n=1 Tax=Spartinivicinus marinus TaxID=2994442 RepID=A0A853HXA7_9GAMM|nr:sodium:alanine symporter family protein [Spartinivicinus marinus]MCX4029219.1 sodium:alanine symporter family protein [Spartinivicinus marinus]NYZ65873.1 sodium:alanine symporter family protein [Spartinivicinus marinus]
MEILNSISGFVWGPAMLFLILGVGFFLSFRLGFMPIRKLGLAFKLLWGGRKESKEAGEISPFNALMTSLSATIGTGNIAGVATAITLGGPGALFWMWCTALVGMATKYGEAVCAVKYREKDKNGNHVGGPMYYIKNGLPKSWLWLGTTFAVLGSITGFGMGNTVQANSVANALQENFSISPAVTGIVMMVLVGAVLIGGIKSIAKVAGKLVPFMAIAYLLAGLVVLALNLGQIPAALELIFTSAFSGTAATGGFVGAGVAAAIRFGVARGVFSNEAGIGSAPIAHASAQTNSPVRQGLIAMLGTFIDTIIVCSITGLAIVSSGAWQTTSGVKGAAMTSLAFETTLPGIGSSIVTIGLAIFAFTTILGWSVYGERCVQYLLGEKAIVPFRLIWVIAVPVGAIASLDLVWIIADILNALMAIPNLIALAALSPVIIKLTREYFAKSQEEIEGQAVPSND